MHKQVQYLKFDEACELVSLINTRKYLPDTRYKILAHLTRICALCQGPELEAGGQKGCGTWLTNSFKCFHCCRYKFARVATAPATAPCAVCKSQHFVNLIAALCKLSGRHRGRRREAGGRSRRHSQDDLVTHSRRCHCLRLSLCLSLFISLSVCLPIACALWQQQVQPLLPLLA